MRFPKREAVVGWGIRNVRTADTCTALPAVHRDDVRSVQCRCYGRLLSSKAHAFDMAHRGLRPRARMAQKVTGGSGSPTGVPKVPG